ncbi:MAG: pantetheine-phosphate adenylyltransferase [Bacteroidales bacterium]|nr:pantetheine-phosphate adenylyltransferase [Bacteroidales bacterium]
MRTALFPGSFNPFTKGHADIVERGLKLFDRIVIAIGYNEQKADTGDIDSRITAIRSIYKDDKRVDIIAYSGLTIDAARQHNCCAILRSVRSVKDYEYELQMADVNRQLSGIETVVLFARPELASISSSMVRELQHFGHDITDFLP